jgi:hypothetical protein
MIAITAGLCLATSLLFGWLPAARFSRPAIMTVLKDEAGIGGVRTGRAHRLAAALQVAIAVPLLVLCAMSLERVRATARADLGFAADLVYAAPIELPAASTNSGFRIRTVSETLARADGVDAVTVADGLPLDFRYRLTRVSTQTAAGDVPKVVDAHVTRVGDGYLDAMDIPLIRGRGFTTDDTAGAELVTLISQPLAHTLFADADPIGQRIVFGSPGNEARPQKTLTVVGVTADFPTSQMSTDREQLLLPLAQHSNILRDAVPVEDDRSGAVTLMLIARSAPGEPPDKLRAALVGAIRALDPDVGSTGESRSSRASQIDVVTGVWLRQNSMDDFLTQSAVAGTTAGIALLLAALGIYGVVGLMVATRTREIAVRVTLGASRPRVMAMIIFDVVRLVAPGVGAGLLAAGALVRLNGGILGIPLSNLEPLAYLVGAAIATLTAVLASLPPARRAASVQPMVAMRST